MCLSLHANDSERIAFLKSYIEMEETPQSLLDSTNKLARLLGRNNKYQEAIKYALKASEFATELQDKPLQGDLLYYVSVLYQRLGEDGLSIEYGAQALEIAKSINDSVTIAASCHRLGIAYYSLEQNEQARFFLEESLAIRETFRNPYVIAASNNALGLTYLEEDPEYANTFFVTAMKNWKSIEDHEGIAIASGNIADVYLAKGDTSAGIAMYRLSYNSAIKDNVIYFASSAAFKLSELYARKNEMDSAYYFHLKYSAANDSLINMESTRALEEMRAVYELDQTEKKVQAQKELADERGRQITFQFYILILVSILGLTAIILLFQAVKQARLRRQIHNDLVFQKQIVDEKNKSITDSINYAKRIQSAILPTEDSIKKALKNSFILYLPKDIVAGDFYWLAEKDNKILFAAADCTGHGVPGAMVSVICNNALNRSVKEYGITSPGKILDKAKEIITAEFEKSKEPVRDGMDIAICQIENNTLRYAGAHNPAWVIRKGELIELKADKQPIGNFDYIENYNTQEFQLQKDDMIYVFTDGYSDQFGGMRNKKLKIIRFKKLLLDLHKLDVSEQKSKLNEFLNTWKGNMEQIDDICVMGIRI